MTVSDINGNVLFWSSAGNCGFKGAKKGTPYAAQVACGYVLKKAVDQGMRQVEIHVSGVGSSRDSAIREVQNFGLFISLIKDSTPVPHNGCRPKKKRRV